jgi:carbon-monoxide dehydrogenase medium subunit
MRPFDYIAPRRLDEAVNLLAKTRGAVPLAGGNRLLVDPSRSSLNTPLLVDLRRIDGLTGITVWQDGRCSIGAMTTLATLARDAGVRTSFTALAEAAEASGDPQARNRATLGGSLAANDSADDLPAALLALDGEVQVTGPAGTRTVDVGALLIGAGQTSLKTGELITAVTLPRPEARTGTAYEKVRNPSTLAAVCGVAAALTLALDGTASSCRVSLVGSVRSAIRLPEVESALLGQTVTAQAIEKTAGRAVVGVTMRNDLFASTEYRSHLSKVLTQRALTRAFERASR